MDEKSKIIRLIHQLFNSPLSAEQREELQHLHDDPTLREKVGSIMESQWDDCSGKIDIESYHRIKRELLTRIKGERKIVVAWQKYGLSLLRYAAVIAVAIGSTIAVMQLASGTKESFVVATDRGQQSQVILPDGTRIWLNVDTKLTYNEDYNDKNRNIAMEGEAYFEVAKNPEVPFIVTVGDISVKALGTRFNIDGYSNENFVDVSLFDGAVEAAYKDQHVLLHPQEEVQFSCSDGRFLEKSRMHDNIAFWRTKRLKFENSKLYDIANQIERMYNIECVFEDPALSELSYTGVINNASINSIVNLIESTSPVKCEIVNGILVIKNN